MNTIQKKTDSPLKEFLVGAAIGIANLIPGVSGGTLALIFNIYEKLIRAVNQHNSRFLSVFLKNIFKFHKAENRLEIKDLLQRSDTFFIFKIAAGAFFIILILSAPLKYALLHYREAVYAFFLALILPSIRIPLRHIPKKTTLQAALFTAVMILTLFFSLSADPSQQIIAKSDYYKSILTGAPAGSLQSDYFSVKEGAGMFFAGTIAVSAMILPGLSGSFVLLLMGAYEPLISAVANIRLLLLNDILTLVCFAFGCAAGLLLFCRLLEFLFSKFKNVILAGLSGLIAGSTAALWPFRKFITVTLYQKNGDIIEQVPNSIVYTGELYFPGISKTFDPPFSLGYYIAVLICFAAGSAVMQILTGMEKK